MKFTSVVILVLTILGQIAFADALWPNEPAGSQVMIDCPFDNADCGGKLKASTPGKLTQPGAAPFSSPNALASHLPKGASQGGQHTTWPTSATARAMGEIYVGFWWKMNADFQGYKNSSNKLFFIRNFEYPFGKATTNGCFLLYGGADNFPWTLVFSHNTGGLDNSHVCPGFCNPNIGSVPIHRDTWYRIETYIKSSTCSTCKDGTVRWWIDGKLAGNYTTLNYGSGNMNEFTIGHTWDGQSYASCYDASTNPSGRDCSREWFHYFDHLRISAPNCGASGCPVQIPLGISSIRTNTTLGVYYNDTLKASGGNPPYFWSVSGNLPAGLSLKGNVISGTPTILGPGAFTAKVTDAAGATATRSFTIIVSKPAAIAGGGLTVNSYQLTARTGNGNVVFQMPEQRTYSLSVFDLSGREVWKHAGTGEAVWNHGGKLQKGIYLVRAEQSGKTMTASYCQM